MNINTYEIESRKTAQYPTPVLGENEISYIYPLLGLISESLELLESVEMDLLPEEILKECGDVIWYSFAVIRELNLGHNFMIESATIKIPADDWEVEIRTSLKILSSNFKKSILGNSGEISDKYFTSTETAILNILCVVRSIIIWNGSTLEEVMEKNIEKLTSRKERGVIIGDGDNR